MVQPDDLEAIPSDVMERVLSLAEAYDASAWSEKQVRRAIHTTQRGVSDFAALLSPSAAPLLEEMAQAARSETRCRFGNSVSLFTPIYISNHCENQCVYCGFNARNRIHRTRLPASGIESEMRGIAESGLREILILTGESRVKSDVEYIGEACEIARKYFRAVGVEVYPMDVAGYAHLLAHGADFVTVFQETYDPVRYGEVHPGGRKRVFPYRFNAQERALIAGFRGVGFAALLGLSDFRKDAFATGLHAYFIQRKYPHAEISFSCPRLRPVRGGSAFRFSSLTEAELLQVICAYRLFMPYANITLSSRENARFRDNVVGIAATKISAGVSVAVGGHSGIEKSDGQFEIDDARSVDEIRRMLASRGLQAVMSDYL
ncbi:MAG: 2-iminoacetate synthase ThiH [Candidatus Accumulibacter sp.]|jgi:2-iminoacetate synthase|nr:2-iminoacetate synthase ThiH [Accumulibacter sp.]